MIFGFLVCLGLFVALSFLYFCFGDSFQQWSVFIVLSDGLETESADTQAGSLDQWKCPDQCFIRGMNNGPGYQETRFWCCFATSLLLLQFPNLQNGWNHIAHITIDIVRKNWDEGCWSTSKLIKPNKKSIAILRKKQKRTEESKVLTFSSLAFSLTKHKGSK